MRNVEPHSLMGPQNVSGNSLNKTGGWKTYIFCLEVIVNRKTTSPPSSALASVANHVRAPGMKATRILKGINQEPPSAKEGKEQKGWGGISVTMWSGKGGLVINMPPALQLCPHTGTHYKHNLKWWGTEHSPLVSSPGSPQSYIRYVLFPSSPSVRMPQQPQRAP